MESIIKWEEGTPIKNGAYLTIKKSECKKDIFIQEDYWDKDHWIYRCSCGIPKTLYWAKIDSIDISKN